jgi:hypothetical protein
MVKHAVPIAALVLALAGCGGGSTAARHGPPRPETAKQRRLARLASDVRLLRADAAGIHGNSTLGTPRIQRATSRYLHDLDTAKLDDLTKNRQIDFAAAAVAGVCDQCFEMVEADRPIPALAGQ